MTADMKSSEAMIPAAVNAFFNCVKKPEKFRTSTGFEPVTSRYRCDALTNWAMKPLTLGAGHLWVLMFTWGMNQRRNDIRNGPYMNCGYEIKWSSDPRSYERNFCNCLKKPEKFRLQRGLKPVTSRYRCDALTNWSLQLWVDSFLTGLLEPTNDQLPTSVAS